VNKSLPKMKLCKLYVQVVPRHLLRMSKLILIRLKIAYTILKSIK